MFERLEELAALEADWDSYGGEPPTRRSVATAARLMAAAWDRLGARYEERAQPYEVMPIADGGLQLEWRGGAERIELNVGPAGAISFLHVVGTGDTRAYREGDDLAWSAALELVERMVRA